MKEEFLMEQNENTENERETVSSEEEKLDKELDEILADVLRFSQKKDSENEMEEMEETEETVTTPAFSVPEPEQEDPLVSMTVQMKALTEEIRLLRTQLAGTHGDGEPEEKAQEIPDICGEPKPEKKNRVLHILGNAVFYLVMIGIVIGALAVKSGSSGQPVMVAGFSAFRVLTSSMEDVYPKGSLIISKKTDPDALAVGDDITFMISSTSS
ncbi:MAG: hypothetical protein IJX14_03020, partial [Clostridia bacterium]|nr:hypothetical protein [Clostridia bacterium]